MVKGNKIIKKLINILNVISIINAAALAAAIISTYISPEKIFITAFLCYLYPILFGINFFMLVLFVFHRKKMLWITLLLFISGYNLWQGFFQFAGRHSDHKKDETSVTVMTYNVRMFDQYGWAKRKYLLDSIFSYIKQESPDIICFQEFYVSDRRSGFSQKYISDKLEFYPYDYVEYLPFKKSDLGKTGTAVFSKFPIIKKEKIDYGIKSDNGLITDIDINGITMRLLNVRLASLWLSPDDIETLNNIRTFKITGTNIKAIVKKIGIAFSNRAVQADTLNKIVERSPYPVIICGDFNDTPASYTYRETGKELNDAFIEAGSGIGGTYNGKLPSYRIDYILFDPAFEAFNYKRSIVNYSDHYPVSVCLRLKE
jgi:endonuclease/exonuclease/phosphatase family metal-dependent hydrolase